MSLQFKQKQTGFTLIEIAIVLVIIGLLAGGILKGQQMIENAKYKAWIKRQDEIRVAVATFKDRYGYWPGDYPKSVVNGVTVLPGNGDGIMNGGNANPLLSQGYEGPRSVQHLVAAGLMSGDMASDDVSTPMPIGGMFAYMTHRGGLPMMYFYNIPVEYARRLDADRDDGNETTGTVKRLEGIAWPADNSANVSMLIRL